MTFGLSSLPLSESSLERLPVSTNLVSKQNRATAIKRLKGGLPKISGYFLQHSGTDRPLPGTGIRGIEIRIAVAHQRHFWHSSPRHLISDTHIIRGDSFRCARVLFMSHPQIKIRQRKQCQRKQFAKEGKDDGSFRPIIFTGPASNLHVGRWSSTNNTN